jgi:hypothetical protein
MREALELGIHHRRAARRRNYYSRSVRLLVHLLNHPELLEKELQERDDY